MLPISEKYEQSLCELKSIDNRILGAGYIQSINETGIEISFRDDSRTLIAANTLVKVSIYNDKLGFKVVIGKVYVGTMDFVRLVEVVSLMEFEKREFFRINIFEKAILFKDEVKTEEIAYTQKPSIQILVNNISLCGVYFNSIEKFNENEHLFLLLELPNNSAIYPCVVKRVFENEDENHYGYGCEFINQHQRQSDELYKYIYLKQVEYLKRLREEQTI